MKKVAVFGNTGAGKSTLSRKLAEATKLPLHVLDLIKYQPGGLEVSDQEFRQAHEQILEADEWIIEGYGSLETLWPRLNAADTLVYIDLSLSTHVLWVTKRLIKGLFKNPEGWPENTPIFKSSWNSYRTVWICHKLLTPRYRDFVHKSKTTKTVFHLKSVAGIAQFLDMISSQEAV